MHTEEMNPRLLVLLLLPLIFINPLSLDLYLPALPHVRESLHTTASMAQWTLSIFILGFGTSQLFVGLLASKLGTGRILLVAVIIYTVATIGCVFSSSIYQLIFFRLVQAIMSGIVTVVSIALVRRILSGSEQNMKAYSWLLASASVSPIIAPSIGTQLMQFGGWQAIFIFLTLFSLFGLVVYYLKIKPIAANFAISEKAFSAYMTVCKSVEFWRYAMAGAMSMAITFSFFSIAPLLFMDCYQYSSAQFSLFFGAYGAFCMVGNLLGPTWAAYWGNLRGIAFAYYAIIFLAVLLWATTLLPAPPIAVAAIMSLINFFIGITFGPAMTGAMKPFKKIAEQAASIYGFQQYFIAFTLGTWMVCKEWLAPVHIALEILLISLFLLLFLFFTRGQNQSEQT